MILKYLILLILCYLICCCNSFNILKSINNNKQIKNLLETSLSINKSYKQFINPIIPIIIISISSIHPIYAIESKDNVIASLQENIPTELLRLKKGLKEINYLLDNWNEKTTYCNFGEIQKDLLKSENKNKLLIAAAETSLLDYDKSKTMITMCKKDPQMVRALLGLTSDNLTLNRAELLMKKSSTVNRVNDNDIESYFESVEEFSNALSEIDSLTYEARSDFASNQNLLKDESINTSNNKNDYLQQSKNSVINARDALQNIIKYLSI